jgi:serine protease AprX
VFHRTFPQHHSNQLLSTPERTGALPQYSGRGVVMAFIDSGFYPHLDLDDRVLIHVDATTDQITEGTRFRRPACYSWHGQMTSVIAAGNGRTSGGIYRGIASEAQLVLIKVSSPRGRIQERGILRGLRWLIEHYRRFNVRVLNLSVGGDEPSDDPQHPIYVAVRTLTDQGVTVLAAAGNGRRGYLVPPGSAPEAITVGGYDDHNSLDRAGWQPYANDYGVAYGGGRKPEVIAPAAWIASPILPGSTMEREARWLAAMLDAHDEQQIRRLLREGYIDLNLAQIQAQRPTRKTYAMLQSRIAAHKLADSHHQYVDGTSVAVAIASSVVAQMLEANDNLSEMPRLTPARIKAILMRTALPLPDIPLEQQGAGVIDAAAAVSATLSLP